MSFEIPTDRQYTESHEWLTTTDGPARVGITDFAQDELGDVVFVELPAVGEAVTAGETLGVVESIKAVSGLYSPVSGEVVTVNEAVIDAPGLVNDDPYGEGWMIEVSPATDWSPADLLTAEEYREQTT